jgi:hypothetical protein
MGGVTAVRPAALAAVAWRRSWGALRRANPWAVGALVAVNAVPLVGVAVDGWRVLDLLLLYWFESGVVGAVTLLKIWTAAPEGRTRGDRAAQVTGAFLLTPFFLLHYGTFWLAHGALIALAFVGPAGLAAWSASHDGGLTLAALALGPTLAWPLLSGPLALPAAALAGSHALSYATDYLAAGERRAAAAGALMRQPYGRVVALHLALFLGGGATASLGEPIAALLLLVAGKTLVDLRAHVHEREVARERSFAHDRPRSAVPAPVSRSRGRRRRGRGARRGG